MTADLFVSRLIEDLRQGQLAVLAGAGVSLQSGAPIVAPLVTRILSALDIDSEVTTAIVNSALPFELTMESIAKEVPVDRLMDVFNASDPSAAHHLMARLARRGAITTIVTTNFDELFERALEMAGAVKGRDYVVTTTSQLRNVNWETPGTSVLKLHGTISDRDGLGVTLQAVASGAAAAVMQGAMRNLVADPRSKSLLVLGYSCSDHFDISPAIESSAPGHVRVMFLDHSHATSWESARVEAIGLKPEKNPFHAYAGERLFGVTGDVISRLWDAFFPGESPGPAPPARDWQRLVDEWAVEIRGECGDDIGHRIASTLLLLINDYPRARAELQKARAGDDAAELISRIAYTYQAEGDLAKAAELYSQAAEQSRSEQDIIGFLQRGGSLAEVSRLMGRSKDAIHLLEENHKTLDRMALEFPGIRTVAMGLWTTIKTNQLIYLGNAYTDVGDTRAAMKCFEQARELARSVGDKSGETHTLGSMGRALRLEGQEDLAEARAKQARQIAQQIGSPELLRKLGDNIMEHRYLATGDDSRSRPGARTRFDRTDHHIKKTQTALLLDFMNFLENMSSIGKDAAARQFATFQERDLTCWECGHVFPVLQGLSKPPDILACPGCLSPLAGFRPPD